MCRRQTITMYTRLDTMTVMGPTFNPGASSEYNRSDRPPDALPRLAAGVAPRPPDAPDDAPPPDDADAPPAVARRRRPVGISPVVDDIMTSRIKQKGKEDLRRRGGKRRWMGNGQDGNVDG